MNKKGAIELSMTKIIVIVIGVVLLSLGLLWVKGAIEEITKNCEKNPNAKGCVCDEYRIDDEDYIIEYDYDDKGNFIIGYMENESYSCTLYKKDEKNKILTYKCNYKNICIKSHNPNECEKGNKDYVWENKTRIEKINNLNFTWCSPFFLDYQCERFNRTSKEFKSDCVYIYEIEKWNQGYCGKSDEWLKEHYQSCIKRELEFNKKCKETPEFIENKIIEYECREKTDEEGEISLNQFIKEEKLRQIKEEYKDKIFCNVDNPNECYPFQEIGIR